MSKDNTVGEEESPSCKVYTDGFFPKPGIYRGHDLDFERIYYRFNMLESSIQDISLQIKELKELSKAQTNILTDVYDVLQKLLDTQGVNTYSSVEEMINKIKNDDE